MTSTGGKKEQIRLRKRWVKLDISFTRIIDRANIRMTNEICNDEITEEIDSHFELEKVEQLQAISDPIRYRMILLLRNKAMTGAQLARALNLSRSRAHYYLKTLVDSDLVRYRGEKIDNGMIGKYYRARASYFSYDNLASQSREVPPSDPLAVQIFKAISDFAVTVLETSRNNIHVSEEMARGYHFNFETNLTEAQYDAILGEIRSIVDHLIAIKRQNQLSKDKANLHFRTTIFFTPTPRNPIQSE